MCACIVKMEGELGSSSQGRKSSLFVSGMGVPEGKVVMPGGLAET